MEPTAKEPEMEIAGVNFPTILATILLSSCRLVV